MSVVTGSDPAGSHRAARRTPRHVAFVLENELIGDAIMHVPAYRAVRSALPEARITLLVRRATAFTGPLSRIAPEFFDAVTVGAEQIADPGALADWMAEAGADLVFDFRANARALASWTAAGRSGAAQIANVPGYALRRRLGVWPERRPEHNNRRFHRMAEIALGRALAYDARLPDQPDAADLARRALPQTGRLVGISPGDRRSDKSWPLASHSEMARRLAARGATPVYFIGPDEQADREAMLQAAPGAVALGLPEAGGDPKVLLWLFHAAARRLDALVASEGGIGHVAATQDLPLVTLSGPTNAHRWRPVTTRWTNVRAQGFGGKVLADIPVDAIETAVAAWLDDPKGWRPDAAA